MERPIHFTDQELIGIRHGRKTQFRRIVKQCPTLAPDGTLVRLDVEGQLVPGSRSTPGELLAECPFGQAGDALWVQEYWRPMEHGGGWRYYLDTIRPYKRTDLRGWHPPYEMPREASRTTLAISAVRMEEVQAITVEDAMAEGMLALEGARTAYKQAWDRRSRTLGKHNTAWTHRETWNANPLVWVVVFTIVQP